jgi:hypothetical protein
MSRATINADTATHQLLLGYGHTISLLRPYSQVHDYLHGFRLCGLYRHITRNGRIWGIFILGIRLDVCSIRLIIGFWQSAGAAAFGTYCHQTRAYQYALSFDHL